MLKLQAAYNTAQNGEALQSKAVTSPENLDIGMNKSIVMNGGYDCGFAGNSGTTVISGNVTISSGKVTIQSGIIKVQ